MLNKDEIIPQHIILLYDTDKTGLEASLKHAQQLADSGVKRLVLPLAGTKQEKDISDFSEQKRRRAHPDTPPIFESSNH